jgi:hypothetical protein
VPEVIKNIPKKSFQYFSWYFTAIDRTAGDFGLACHCPFNYHEATMMAYNPILQPTGRAFGVPRLHRWTKPDVLILAWVIPITVEWP